MFKLFWTRTTRAEAATDDWRHDPMGHPALQRMGLRDLADLPMVAEIPTRALKVEVAAARHQAERRQHPAGCAASR